MIKLILDLLRETDAISENIQIAKGKYKMPTTIKEGIKQIKNEHKWQKRL